MDFISHEEKRGKKDQGFFTARNPSSYRGSHRWKNQLFKYSFLFYKGIEIFKHMEAGMRFLNEKCIPSVDVAQQLIHPEPDDKNEGACFVDAC